MFTTVVQHIGFLSSITNPLISELSKSLKDLGLTIITILPNPLYVPDCLWSRYSRAISKYVRLYAIGQDFWNHKNIYCKINVFNVL